MFDKTDPNFDKRWAGPPELKPAIYRTQSEKDTFHAVAVENEYQLPKLQPDDVVIDIGAHIGSFSHIARRFGSKNIYAFEIDSWHIEAAFANLREGLEAHDIVLHHAAVVRGDQYRSPQYFYNGAWNSFGVVGEPVNSISLDQILEPHETVRFLKLDCEGGEWPILSTCSQLHKVQEIAGEFHIIDASLPEVQNLPMDMSAEGLRKLLEENGFNITLLESDKNIGNFHAVRKGVIPKRPLLHVATLQCQCGVKHTLSVESS